MQIQAKLFLCITAVNTKFFPAVPTSSLIPSVGPFPDTKKIFFDYWCERMKH